MATEPNFNAVPPVSLIADGSSEGVIQVVDTAGFYIKMQATLRNNQDLSLTVYIKRVVDQNTLWVGLTNRNMLHDADCSAFTVLLGSNIEAAEQSKHSVSMEAQRLSTYENDPVDAWRTIPIDSYGNHYTSSNTFPTNLIPTSGIPFTLGSLALPAFFSDLVSKLTFDQVTSSTVGNQETLTFYLLGSVVTVATLTKTATGWSLNLSEPTDENLLLLESGDLFVLENGTGGILLEN